MGIESVSVHLKYTKLVTVRFFPPLFHKEGEKKVCFMIFIWKNLLWLACPDGNILP